MNENNEKDLDPIIKELIDKLISPVMVIDGDGVILYSNRIMRETFGDLSGHSRSFLFKGSTFENDENLLINEGRRKVILADVPYDIKWSTINDEDKYYQIFILDDISESTSARTRMQNSIRKIKQESDIAKQIQSSILPADGEYDEAVKINSVYMPADDLGGDVFGIVRVSSDETMFYMADVSGHGIQASLLTVFLRESIRSLGKLASQGLNVLIEEVMRNFIALDIDSSIYATILFCSYNKPKKELAIANAGHNCMPLIIRQNGRLEEIQVRGMPVSRLTSSVGVMPDEEIIGIDKGDRIVLYTDGIIEEYSRAEKGVLGSEGVRRLAAEMHGSSGKDFARKVISESDKYFILSASDDRTILVVDIIA